VVDRAVVQGKKKNKTGRLTEEDPAFCNGKNMQKKRQKTGDGDGKGGGFLSQTVSWCAQKTGVFRFQEGKSRAGAVPLRNAKSKGGKTAFGVKRYYLWVQRGEIGWGAKNKAPDTRGGRQRQSLKGPCQKQLSEPKKVQKKAHRKKTTPPGRNNRRSSSFGRGKGSGRGETRGTQDVKDKKEKNKLKTGEGGKGKILDHKVNAEKGGGESLHPRGAKLSPGLGPK